jgi:predicted CoA-substrate-specific enzyme activase
MNTLGICFGATSMQCVFVQSDPQFHSVARTERIAHEGNTRAAFIDFFNTLDTFEIDRIAVTGRGFRNAVKLTSISEPEAVERALRERFDAATCPSLVISAGGETQLAYRIGPHGGVSSVQSGGKCASGTGEFFLQQIRRMDLDVEQAIALATQGEPHTIAGRCSVFCKSDCTHALNKGESRANIAAGLCVMMADKIGELLKDVTDEPLALIGGGSLNSQLVSILQSRYPRLSVPEYAAVFEAYGAALWACDHECVPAPDSAEEAAGPLMHSFSRHEPLAAYRDRVDFKAGVRDAARDNDECILGLDVGSTTTKAALIRRQDSRMLASVYLRTNGDPIAASRNCYRHIREQVGAAHIRISGLGVTGSGRQIAGLHACTSDIINEIVAHAAAAAHFDPHVDTIFEIGGQDAKYTRLTQGVPSDYAMNEACSAGTGSFLEESARESLNIETERIGELAMTGDSPPNFTDQCAAFISSDIKRAGQEGVSRENILAGLVYSICLNYLNRVKGERAVGTRLFMQGGVCYNEAVPVAMAALMRTRIVVPPDPGLMGAFGVALEVSRRQQSGLSVPGTFDLDALAAREAVREGGFICAGGREQCDRKCEIARIRIGDTVYPFGGGCDRWYNQRLKQDRPVGDLNFVALRQRLMFDKYGPPEVRPPGVARRGAVGLNRSFLFHAFYPLFANFFARMGYDVVTSDEIDREGFARMESSFCLPAEIAHGAFVSLLRKKPDYIFLPQVMQAPVENAPTFSRTCVFVQGEPYYLRATFRRDIEQSGIGILSPVVCMDSAYEAGIEPMCATAVSMGVSEKEARKAFLYACEKQRAFDAELLRQGKRALRYLEKNPESFGIVLFGRPYNAFADEASMGIPNKIASRGHVVIPFDMLSAQAYPLHHKMFWAMGQKNLRAAQYVRDHRNLFGVFVTNFSCGPDSFVLHYFGSIMREKPSLTLELDQHTADAGIDTRIEAALDIMKAWYRGDYPHAPAPPAFRPARYSFERFPYVYASSGEKLALQDPRVEIIVPSMGSHVSQITAAALRSLGIAARALPIPDYEVLSTGRKNTTCKECLPYILCTGAFLRYLEQKQDRSIVTVFLMATGSGPCRLGQYFVAFEQLIRERRIPNAAMLTVTDENGYGGMGSRALLKVWQGIVISDVFGDIRSLLRVAARRPDEAVRALDSLWRDCVRFFDGRLSMRLTTLLSLIAQRLRAIELRVDPAEIPVISLVGEIYVRRDEFSRKNIVEYLEQRGFAVRIAPLGEYPCYSNFVVNSGLIEHRFDIGEIIRQRLTGHIMEWWERRIKSILAESGLYSVEMIEVGKTIGDIDHLLHENFRGECILTVGVAMREILHTACGVISIGPFGCMPSRMAESILKKEMNVEGKKRMKGWGRKAGAFADIGDFPFLSVETDGNAFPQIIEANLEAFVLQARRLHARMLELQGKTTAQQNTSSVSIAQ